MSEFMIPMQGDVVTYPDGERVIIQCVSSRTEQRWEAGEDYKWYRVISAWIFEDDEDFSAPQLRVRFQFKFYLGRGTAQYLHNHGYSHEVGGVILVDKSDTYPPEGGSVWRDGELKVLPDPLHWTIWSDLMMDSPIGCTTGASSSEDAVQYAVPKEEWDTHHSMATDPKKCKFCQG